MARWRFILQLRPTDDEMHFFLGVEIAQKLDADQVFPCPLEELQVIRVVDEARKIGVFVVNEELVAPLDRTFVRRVQDIFRIGARGRVCEPLVSPREP